MKQLKPMFSKEEVDACIQKDGLLMATIEVTKLCNVRCVFCYGSAGEKAKDEMTLDEITGVIDQVAALGAKRILISGGEPTLQPGLGRIIEHAVSKGLKVMCFTNGSSMTPVIARKLCELDCTVILKLLGSAATHDSLTRSEGSHKRAMVALRMLLDAGFEKKRNKVAIHAEVTKQNIGELPELWTWARKEGFFVSCDRLVPSGRAKDNADIMVSSDELHALFERLLKIDQEQFGLTWDVRPTWTGPGCDTLHYDILVRANGDIQPCEGIDIKIGDVRSGTLKDAVKHPVMQTLRRINENIKGACKDCEFNMDCYGCPGAAYQLTGDFLQSDPMCWKNPKKVN
jgi:radical SAM protein with 4Fe4S-binding SPASM domain